MSEQNFEKVLNEKGIFAFVPNGNSMWPTLKHGKHSVIIVKKTCRLSPLDVAFYKKENGEGYIMHRVIEVTDTGYICLGDSTLYKETVIEDRVIGVMQGYYKKDKFIKSTNPKYLNKVKRWFKHKNLRKFRLKIFYFKLRVKSKLKRTFCKNKGSKND